MESLKQELPIHMGIPTAKRPSRHGAWNEIASQLHFLRHSHDDHMTWLVS